METNGNSFLRLVKIMNELREQCPWDKKQTIHTLRHLTIEETYELADAITEDDWMNIKEELGDILLHLTFYTKIATEENQFSLDEMINAVCDKLINRHPHIYGEVKVNNEDDVKRNWEQIKLKEGKGTKTTLGGVPKSLPALVKAIRIQDKVKQVGFEWDNKDDVWKKVEEEMGELQEAVTENHSQEHVEEEFGDLMFSMINYARFLNIDAEEALEKTNKKFIKRFNAMEAMANESGNQLHNMNLEQMDALWNLVKKNQSE